MTEFGIVLPYTPPSLNAMGRANHYRQHRAKLTLQHDLEMLLMASGLPRDSNLVIARAVLRFPSARRRDEGNFRWLLEKALGDALTNGRWLPDDTPEHFRFERLQFDPEPGRNRAVITMEVS